MLKIAPNQLLLAMLFAMAMSIIGMAASLVETPSLADEREAPRAAID